MSELEEKILFQHSAIKKTNYKKLSIYLFCFALFLFIVAAIVALAVMGRIGWMFEGIRYGYYFFYIFSALSIILGIIFLFLKKEASCTVTITNRRVDLKLEQKSFKKSVDYEVFIPNSTIEAVEASKSHCKINIKGTGHKIDFPYMDGALEALTKVVS